MVEVARAATLSLMERQFPSLFRKFCPAMRATDAQIKTGRHHHLASELFTLELRPFTLRNDRTISQAHSKLHLKINLLLTLSLQR
jgi:hypothetical protein